MSEVWLLSHGESSELPGRWEALQSDHKGREEREGGRKGGDTRKEACGGVLVGMSFIFNRRFSKLSQQVSAERFY